MQFTTQALQSIDESVALRPNLNCLRDMAHFSTMPEQNRHPIDVVGIVPPLKQTDADEVHVRDRPLQFQARLFVTEGNQESLLIGLEVALRARGRIQKQLPDCLFLRLRPKTLP